MKKELMKMKKVMRKVMAMLMAAVMCAGIGVTVWADDRGVLNEDGTWTPSGTGALSAFTFSSPPLEDGEIRKFGLGTTVYIDTEETSGGYPAALEKIVDNDFDIGRYFMRESDDGFVFLENGTAYTFDTPGFYLLIDSAGSGWEVCLEIVNKPAAPKAEPKPAPAETAVVASKTTATPTAAKVFIDGAEISFDAYNIDGANFVKLRDMAISLTGTEKRFDVAFDEAANAISLLPGSGYIEVGGEMAAGDGKNKEALLTTSKIMVNGAEIQLTAYNIGGNNYFKLRDIGKTFDFSTTYDDANKAIMIDTALPYTD
jgi:hypothetical protein